MTFECNITGGGTTVFQGSGFHCQSSRNEIKLLHSRFNSSGGTNGTCNNGAIVGQSKNVENNVYTSLLYITISSDLIGSTIECLYDNGTSTETVGSYLVPATTTTTTTATATAGTSEDLTLIHLFSMFI